MDSYFPLSLNLSAPYNRNLYYQDYLKKHDPITPAAFELHWKGLSKAIQQHWAAVSKSNKTVPATIENGSGAPETTSI